MTPEQELREALRRLDVRIEREIYRLRGRYQLSLDEFRGLFVSDAQVDSLLRTVGLDPAGPPLPEGAPFGPRWQHLATRLGLDKIEQDLLLLAVAGEIDTRYPALFAYLNDDAARRRPSVDLAMRLVGDDWQGRAEVRMRLTGQARLLRLGLVAFGGDTPGSLASGFAADPLVIAHLLGSDALAIAGAAEACASGSPDKQARHLAALQDGAQPVVLVLAGRPGTGRRTAAWRIAAAGGRRLATIVGAARIADAARAALIEGAALLVEAGEPDEQTVAALKAMPSLPLMLAVRDAGRWERALDDRPLLVRHFAVAGVDERAEQWRAALRGVGVRAPVRAIGAVAARFRLSGGAIGRAAGDVALVLRANGVSAAPRAVVEQLTEAARRQCAIDLGHSAARIDARPGWDDLVVSPEVRRQLRDFAGAGQQRDRVYVEWGMGDVGRGAGKGVIALFTGASGTGKTMSAAVIARETGLDLWRIDLSSVVSKYIGETEKNLERIFSAARDGDAILFFDEADALFGKRSEVKDAHDRYANVEVAYLLQRLEDHDGIAILATNLSRNIDQAFIRRLHYIIEFPLPDQALRERLWRKAFAAPTPMQGTIDEGLLARQFALSGGDIRAAALDAAFLAASNGGAVTMDHVLSAVSRQMLKQGRLPGRLESMARANGHAAAP